MRTKKYLLLLFLMGLIALWIGQGLYLPVGSDSEPVQFQVRPGQGVFQIAAGLEQKRLVKNSFWFTLYSFLKGENQGLQAGNYSLSRSMNVTEIFERINRGRVTPHKFTVVEGWSIEDIGVVLDQQGREKEKFYRVVGYPASAYSELDASQELESDYDFLESKPDRANLEGFLFPDTYYLSVEESSRSITDKMLANFGRQFDRRLRQKVEEQQKTIFEVVVMASLIEKEVKTFRDKRIVAGILWKRLKHDIPLQVDATIIYLTGENSVEVSRAETEIDSPYNTYKYKGLPQGPICNPGLESIRAALNPLPTDYWYYLSVSEGDCPRCTEGGTLFSRSLRQHNLGKARYLD